MTDAALTPRRRSHAILIAAAALLAAVLALGAALAAWRAPAADDPISAPGLSSPVSAAGLAREAHVVLPIVLGRIYRAFSETEEGAIYDGLAGVAAGEALEALYLERAGALASGGLPDQVVHEIRLLSGDWVADGGAVRADIRWAVLGQVGHDAHTHMRGNAYGAELVIEPAGGAWRLTGFDLTDVDRTDAGTLMTLPGEPDGAPSE